MSKILVIEDDPQIQRIYKIALGRAGYEVVIADNGQQGLDLFNSEHPDLVITDIVMPEKDGIETIRYLRRKSLDLKVIAVSGGGRAGAGTYLRPARLMGADRVFAKPMNLTELTDTVAELLSA